MKNIHKLLIVVIILLIIFLIFNYKKSISGNNISIKSKEKIIENILSGKIKYKAEIKVKIISNKNENIYVINQKEDEKESYQEVISKGEIEGVKIFCTDDVLKVENSNLKIEKIYENYDIVTNDYLFLNNFAKDYLKNKDFQMEENDEYIIIKIEIKYANKYIKFKELYLDKKTGKPIKLIIKDGDKQIKASIEYINIEIL